MNQRILLAGLALALSGVLAYVFLAPTPPVPTVVDGIEGGVSAAADGARPFELADGSRADSGAADEVEGAQRRTIRSPRGATKEATEVEIPTGPILKGRIIDSLGRGVPNAKVDMRVPLRDQGLIGLLVEDLLTRQETTTDGLGYFQLIGLPGKRVEFDVGADGYARLEAKEIELPSDFTYPIEDIELRLGLVLHGTVVDLSGRAIEGAQLFVVDPERPDFAFRAMTHPTPDVVTDVEGRFELSRVATGKWAIEVRAEDRPLRTFRGESNDPGRVAHGLWFEIPDGGVIRGLVKGLEPVRYPEFRVEAHPTEGTPFFGGRALERPRAELDADGRFEIRALDPEVEYIVKLAPAQTGLIAFAGVTGTRSQEVTVRPLDAVVELDYRAGARLTFQVLDASDRTPIELFTAKFGQQGNIRTITKPNGEVRVEHRGGFGAFEDLYESDAAFWQSGGWRLEIHATGYEDWMRDGIELKDGVDLEIGEILLMPSGNVNVVVKDAADGSPINSAMVRLTKLSTDGDEERATWRGMDVLTPPVKKTKTGPDGRATLDGFGSAPAELVISRTRYADHVQRIVLGSDDLNVEVLLSAEATVETFARDVNGNELGDVDIEHMAPGAETVSTRMSASNRGRARFRGLMPGEHKFRIAPRDNGAEAAWETVSLSPGSKTSVTLLGPARGRVRGRVLEGAQPVAGASVNVSLNDGTEEQRWERQGRRGGRMVSGRNATTDSAGRFEVDDLEYGEYAIVVDVDGRAMTERAEVTLDRATADIEIQLPSCGAQGVVVDAEGRPIANVEVRALAVDENTPGLSMFSGFDQWQGGSVVEVETTPSYSIGRRTNAAGLFELKGLRAGVKIVLEASHPNALTTRTEPFMLTADEVRDGFRIEMPAAGSITARVSGTSQAMEFYRITARSADGSQTQATIVRGGGVGRLDRLAPGSWRVEIHRGRRSGQDAPLETQVVEVEAWKTTEVAFQPPPE